MEPPKYRMIAIDLDGTLLCPRGTVTPRVRRAIHEALRAGVLVCFATGRNYTESRMVLEAVEHYASAVFVGGAMVIDTARQVTLHRTLMDPELARELCAVLEGMGQAVLALQDTDHAGVDYLISDGVVLNESLRKWFEGCGSAVRRTRGLAQHHHEHTVRIGIVAESKSVDAVRKTLEARFGGRIFVQNIHVPSYGVDVLEVFDPSVNKWEGILHIARRHGIAPQEIVAIGDDVNDIHMIRNAGLGVAMGNARPQIKALANRVIGSNEEEGLASFLEELIRTQAVQPVDDAA
jgi:Cof subfamily protein (haloacid dehalogenase superfamily)